MAYEILYDYQKIYRRKLWRKHFKRPMVTDVIKLTMFVLATYCIAVIICLYLSGQIQNIFSSAEQMVHSLKDGSELVETASVFYAQTNG